MTAEDRCDCCDLPIAWCGKQAERARDAEAAARRAEVLTKPGVTAARWASTCRACTGRISPGDPIKHYRQAGSPDIGQPPWMHADPDECTTP